MPREHDRIRFTDDELAAFLSGDQLAVIATVDAAGDPWCDAAAYTFDGQRILVKVPHGTRTHRNIEADPRVCCVVESLPTGGSYYEIKGAMIHGVAVEVTGGALVEQVRAAADPVEPELAGPCSVFAVGLDDVVSFSFEKIAYRYEDRSTPSTSAPIGS